MLGTNPFAYAIPADEEPPFVLDFATTTVPRGKLEVYQRKEKQLNPGWAIDAERHARRSCRRGAQGRASAARRLRRRQRRPQGLRARPAGRHPVRRAFGRRVRQRSPGAQQPRNRVRSRISSARSGSTVSGTSTASSADLDTELRAFKDSEKAPGEERIYVAGEIEYEKTLYHRQNGVPVHVKVWNGLEKLAERTRDPVRPAAEVSPAVGRIRTRRGDDGPCQRRLARRHLQRRQPGVLPLCRTALRYGPAVAPGRPRRDRPARRDPQRLRR